MNDGQRHPLISSISRGVHHLALCTDDMKATIDFYVDVFAAHGPRFCALRLVWDRDALADEADPEAQRILPTPDALHVHR
jgi:catechol 2,3-dioxygenase-like lactoylglutathione lyase family enzyme